MSGRVAALAGAVLAASIAPPAAAVGELRFVEAGSDAGVPLVTWCGRSEKPHILESGGTGVALFDYDLDGDLDLYLANGWRLEGSEVAERGADALYRNRGDGTFDDVTIRAGLGHDGWGTGVAVGDPDGDGWPDLLVTNFGLDVLYRNRGDGSFEALGDGPGIDGWSTGAVFFDADADGDEDLYVAGYIEATLEEVLEEEPRLDWEGMKVMFGPFGMEGEGNRYFENLGDGTFRDATADAGLTDVGLFYSFGVAALDLDGDLDLDLYVANDSNPNYLYRNDGEGRFQEVGLWSGAALDRMGNAQAGMGLAAGDVDQDGLVDLLVTNFYKDVSTLYRNLGDLVFDDVTRPFAVAEPSYASLSWGAALADLDHDADLDLFIANGHIYPQADRVPGALGYRQRNLLLADEGGRFAAVGEAAGPGLAVEESSRGLALGDLDADGDLDLVVTNCDARPSLLINRGAEPGAWAMVVAPGSVRVEAEAGGARLVRHRVFGGSYVSASDPRLHFGLGTADRVDLRTVGMDGRHRSLRDLPAGRVIVLP